MGIEESTAMTVLSHFIVFLYLAAYVILAAEIVGLVSLAKAGRNAAWWTMVLGIFVQLISALIVTALVFGLTEWGRHFYGFPTSYLLSGLPLLGSLLFAAGFAMHGMRASRASERLSELEILVRVQGEEIRRLSPSSAEQNNRPARTHHHSTATPGGVPYPAILDTDPAFGTRRSYTP